MADGTKIEWTNASWNPIRALRASDGKAGWHCEHVTTGCLNCYAERINLRLGTGLPFKPGHRKDLRIVINEKTLRHPLRWKRPRKVFVCSMTDLFGDFVANELIDQVFAVMAICPQHTFQVLTKRAKQMRDYCSDPQTPFRIVQSIDALMAKQNIGLEEVRPPPAADIQGRHRDRNPTNNAVSNLSWGDQSANWDDAKRHGSHRRYSKLTDGEASEIRHRHAAGETAEGLARKFNISSTQVRNIAAGKQWAIQAQIEWPLVNVWKGVSAERQEEADERLPILLSTPAAIRFVSAEPLLGPMDFSPWLGDNPV